MLIWIISTFIILSRGTIWGCLYEESEKNKKMENFRTWHEEFSLYDLWEKDPNADMWRIMWNYNFKNNESDVAPT